MEKYFKRTILDELYESKGEEFAYDIGEEMSKQNKKFNSFRAEENLTNKIKELIKDEKQQNEIIRLLNQYELDVGSESDFWNKMYYKLGAYDCANMKEVLQDNIVENNAEETNNILIDEYSDNFLEYLERNKMKTLKGNEEYKKITQEIEKLKVDNPNVRTFIEDKEIVSLTDTELNAVLEIIELQGEIDNIELKQSFKLGAREMLVFLKQMKLL